MELELVWTPTSGDVNSNYVFCTESYKVIAKELFKLLYYNKITKKKENIVLTCNK